MTKILYGFAERDEDMLMLVNNYHYFLNSRLTEYPNNTRAFPKSSTTKKYGANIVLYSGACFSQFHHYRKSHQDSILYYHVQDESNTLVHLVDMLNSADVGVNCTILARKEWGRVVKKMQSFDSNGMIIRGERRYVDWKGYLRNASEEVIQRGSELNIPVTSLPINETLVKIDIKGDLSPLIKNHMEYLLLCYLRMSSYCEGFYKKRDSAESSKEDAIKLVANLGGHSFVDHNYDSEKYGEINEQSITYCLSVEAFKALEEKKFNYLENGNSMRQTEMVKQLMTIRNPVTNSPYSKATNAYKMWVGEG